MKRNMDLIRELLLNIEKFPANQHQQTMEVELEPDTDVVMAHLELLEAIGLIEGEIDMDCFAISGLTWEGHDFLDSIRDEGIWTSVKDKLKSVGGSASMSVIKSLAAKLSAAALGL